jgi:hypothetical protein
MARECIAKCPIIQSNAQIVARAARPRPPAAPQPPGGIPALEQMTAMCIASYDCTGPVPVTKVVEVGVFRKRKEVRHTHQCQHPGY